MENQEELQFEIAMSLQKLNELVRKLGEEEPMIVMFGDKFPKMLDPYRTFQILPTWKSKRVRKEKMN